MKMRMTQFLPVIIAKSLYQVDDGIVEPTTRFCNDCLTEKEKVMFAKTCPHLSQPDEDYN